MKQVNLNIGEWIVEALTVIESSTHLKMIAYGLTLAVILRALAKLLNAMRQR